MVDEVLLQMRLENRVGEAQRHQILDGLFAKVMVDAENLAFVEMRGEIAVDRNRAGEVASDRLLDDDTGECPCRNPVD